MNPLTRLAGRLRVLAPLALLGLLVVGCNDPQTTFDPKSDFTEAVQEIYWLVIWLAVVVFVLVLGATVVFSFWFRERPGRTARQIHGNTKLEVLWTLIPVVIVGIIAVPTYKAIVDTTNSDAPDGALQVIVTGHQWWFEFHYPELGVTTANELHLPVDRPVELTLLSADVIHSFWVPQLTGKRDLVPGRENTIWFTPNEAREEPYLGQCAEFCGLSHALMKFRVFVQTQEDFDAWAHQQLAIPEEPTDELLAQGLAIASSPVFTTRDGQSVVGCAACHTIAGTALGGRVGPDLTHVGSRSTIAAGVLENTPENMVRWISNPSEVKPGAEAPRSMPAFEDVLTDEQFQALVAYLQSLE